MKKEQKELINQALSDKEVKKLEKKYANFIMPPENNLKDFSPSDYILKTRYESKV